MLAVGALSSAFCAQSALAQPVPDYDFEWAIIDDVNNPPIEGVNGLEGRGSIPYRYRMATTEVTTSQWLEFVLAYRAYAENPESQFFTGGWIIAQEPDEFGNIEYPMVLGSENAPNEITWRMAARYCNWLHNGKAPEREAFESGVYDASTFTKNEDNSLNDQSTRSPGARFWIPTRDEWLKATHYDPTTKTWWEYPYASAVPMVPAPPEEGGDTNTGLFAGSTFVFPAYRAVGSYPHRSAPWGLLDVSGGLNEMTEDWLPPDFHSSRVILGSSGLGVPSDVRGFDRLISRQPSAPELSFHALRLASPAPPRADLDGDWRVDTRDLIIILSRWGSDDADADQNCDGRVNGADLAHVLASWTPATQ